MPSKEAKMINEMFKSMPREPEGTKHDYVAEREQNAKRPMPELPEGILTVTSALLWKLPL